MTKNLQGKNHPQKTAGGKCESCSYYDFDPDYEAYVCSMSLDEDELRRFLSGDAGRCPYFRLYDEYSIVRKQN